VKFSELSLFKLAHTNSLTAEQRRRMQSWVIANCRSTRQNTVRNTSTRDKAGTLPITLYEKLKPAATIVDFETIDVAPVSRDSKESANRTSKPAKVSHAWALSLLLIRVAICRLAPMCCTQPSRLSQ
jgi:hypothetical protein